MNSRTLLRLLPLLTIAVFASVGFPGCSSDSPTETTDDSETPGTIYYSRATADQKSADIVSIRADGTEEQVVMYNAYAFTPARNGKMLIVALTGGDEEVNLLDISSGSATPIATAHDLRSGGLSWDGTRMWYQSVVIDNQGTFTYPLYVKGVGGATETLIAEETPGKGNAEFSPDGSQLVYYAKRSGSLESDSLFICNSDGTDRRLLTPFAYGTGDDVYTLAWSPDGSYIVFAREGGTTSREVNLWTIRPDGTGERRLAGEPLMNEVTPACTHDGNMVAFTGGIRQASSKLDIDIWTASADGSDKKNLTGTPEESEAEVYPRWSPNGTSVLCISYDLTQPGDPFSGSLHVLNTETGENRTVVEERNVIRAYWVE